MFSVTIPQQEAPTPSRSLVDQSETEQPSVVIKITYHILLETDEDGRVVASCAELKGVVTDGATEDEALKNSGKAVQAMLESLGKKEEFNLVGISAE